MTNLYALSLLSIHPLVCSLLFNAHSTSMGEVIPLKTLQFERATSTFDHQFYAFCIPYSCPLDALAHTYRPCLFYYIWSITAGDSPDFRYFS